MILGVNISNFDVFENELLGIMIEDSAAMAGEEAKKAIRLRSLNAIIGRNNTGKSSFLKTMSFIKRVLNNDAAKASTMDGRPGFSKLVMEVDKPTEFKLFFRIKDKVTGKSKYLQYEITMRANEFGSPVIVSECVKLSCKNGETTTIEEIMSLKDGKGFIVDNNGVKQEAAIGDSRLSALSVYGKISIFENIYALYNEIDGWFFCRFSSQQTNSYYLDGNAPGGHKHLSSSGANVNNVLEYLEKKDPVYYEKVVTEITQKIPQMKKKKTLPVNLETSPDKLFLYLLLLRDQDPHTTIFIETPDKDLYHDMVDVLAGEMRDFAFKFPYNQIIFTTHNPYIVESMSPAEIWVFEREYGEEEDTNVSIRCAGSDPVVVELFKEGVGMGAIWYGGHLDVDESGDA